MGRRGQLIEGGQDLVITPRSVVWVNQGEGGRYVDWGWMPGEGPVGLELQGYGWKSHKSLKLLCWFWSRVASFKGINLLSIPISLRLEDGIGTKNVTGFIGAEK